MNIPTPKQAKVATHSSLALREAAPSTITKGYVGSPLEVPSDCNALVGAQFLIRGGWWKGASYAERQSLYPAQCLAYDEAHPFITRKRKPDLTRVTVETWHSAIKFVLTRPQDSAWDTGDLWMKLSHCSEFGRKYDKSLFQDEKETFEPKKKARLKPSKVPQSEAPTQELSSSSIKSNTNSTTSKKPLQVLAMPDCYQRCTDCSEEHRGRISCWKSCGSKNLRRKLAAAAKSSAAGAAIAARYTCTHTNTRTRTHTRTHSQTHTHTHTHSLSFLLTYTHSYTHIHTPAYTRTLAH